MSEQTKIIQCFLPPMIAGKYQVEVSQSVVNSGDTKTNITAAPLAFGVDAARFTLNDKDIYSVYPPASQFGQFSESLPHIVFSRRTLPWERTIDGKPLKNKQNLQESPPVPWMALLLFDEDEMQELKISNSNVSDIIIKANDKITRPEIYNKTKSGKDILKLMEWENKSDGCFTIDISKAQFEKYIPTSDSLPFLAHAKKVSIADKDKNGITDLNPDGSGTFAVVVGTRLPTPGKTHTAALISLEGFQAYLKDDKGTAEKTIPAGNKVRLVVLANWEFTNSGKSSFLTLFDELENKSMKIKPRQKAPELLPYFDAGYVAMEHLTRAGARTLSWYHGPFLPLLFPTTSKPVSFSAADAALRYDKTTGLFDISFAAAWQLGRMLALQNQGYSKAMLNWRLAQKQLEIAANKKQTLDKITGDSSELPLKEKVINKLRTTHALAVPVAKNIEQDEVDNIPKEVIDFLNKLFRLRGVPFSYLVPHEFFLEKEHQIANKDYTGTLATFFVDPNWIEALLDGALGIGKIANTDSLLNKIISQRLINGLDPENQDAHNSEKVLNITGFLLRSDLISGWRGIEIKALDKNKKQLPALRFEQIDHDIFLGIFQGNISTLTITQPYEGLHFGIKKADGKYQKNLRNKDGTVLANINDELTKSLIKDNILNISGIAKLMKQKLTPKGSLKNTDDNKYFTSAEFAFQMIDSPVKGTIKVTMKTN